MTAEERIKELEQKVERLAAYNKKLLDENIILLNERNEARRKAKSLGVVGITLDAQKGKVTL